jgi:hypothetical protein
MLTPLHRYMKGRPQAAPKQMLVSEIGSLSLEFTKLSHLTGDMRYYDAVQRISDEFDKSQDGTRLPGMWPVVVDASVPSFDQDNGFTLGGMSDSLYEYFPKQYMLLAGRLSQPQKLYEGFIEVAKKHLFHRVLNPENIPIVISGDVHVLSGEGGPVMQETHRGQHLTCFTGGMVGIASRIFERPGDLDLAIQLTDGCVWAYNSTATGIGPEIFGFVPCGHIKDSPSSPKCRWTEEKWLAAVEEHWWSPTDENGSKATPEQVKSIIDAQRLPRGIVKIQDRRYILRPETIESVFIMYRLTGDAVWMEKAWEMFTRIEKLTRTKIAAAALDDVTKTAPVKLDSMESFWLAETLKYFYLIFSDWDVLDLDEWVLNTEAHPLRRLE